MSNEERETTETNNPFLKRLEENQRAKAKAALIQTICENHQHTIGSIFEALEADDTGDYIMLDLFKRMTIEELIIHTANSISSKPTAVKASGWAEDIDDDDDDDDDVIDDDDLDDDDLDDDDLDDDDDDVIDDDDLDDAEPEPVAPVKKKKKGKKGKKGESKTEKKKKAEAKVEAPNEGPNTLGAYKKAILRALKKSDEPMSAQNLKALIGGDEDLFVDAKNELLETGEIESEGKARGTKYSIA